MAHPERPVNPDRPATPAQSTARFPASTSFVSEPVMSGSANRTGLARRMANLLDLGARVAGVPPAVAARVGAVLAHPECAEWQRLGGYSELNSDATPIQLCLTAGVGGRRAVRIIADPAWHLSDPAARLAESCVALAHALPMADAASLGPLCETLLAHAVPAGPNAIRAFPSAFFWLGAGFGRPGFAIYADLRSYLPHDPWAVPREWLAALLPEARPALAVLRALDAHAEPASLALEGSRPERGRAKIYWRLRRPVPLAALGIELLLDPRIAAFLIRVIGDREMNLSGTVMSAGFDLATGAMADVKIDLCAHCLPRSDSEWIKVLDGVCRQLDLALPIEAADLGGRLPCRLQALVSTRAVRRASISTLSRPPGSRRPMMPLPGGWTTFAHCRRRTARFRTMTCRSGRRPSG